MSVNQDATFCGVMLKPTRLLLQPCWGAADPELAGEEKRICAEASQKIPKALHQRPPNTEKLCSTSPMSVNKNIKCLLFFVSWKCEMIVSET